jgi:sugar phosphate isomerase/epimerase
MLIQQNKILCIEPNSKIYNGMYFFNVEEIIDFIKTCELKNIKTMIDTHNLVNENIDIIKSYKNNIDYIYHIHISEDKLQPYKESDLHNKLSYIIKKTNYNKLVTYECLSNKNIENFIQGYK